MYNQDDENGGGAKAARLDWSVGDAPEWLITSRGVAVGGGRFVVARLHRTGKPGTCLLWAVEPETQLVGAATLPWDGDVDALFGSLDVQGGDGMLIINQRRAPP